MALPGVSTVIRDQFQTLTRSNLPDTIRLAVIGRRNNDPDAINATVEDETVPNPNYTGDEGLDNDPENPEYINNPHYHRPVPENFTPINARSESQVIRNFGRNSELHRGFREAVSGGAPSVFLIAWGGEEDLDTVLDNYEEDGTDPFNMSFEAAEAIQADIIVPWGRGGHPDEEGGLGFQATPDMINRVANRCRDITDRSNPCFAVLGVAPAAGAAPLGSTELTAHIEGVGLEDTRENVQPYVAVIATELRPVGYPPEWGYANGAATYGGFLATLRAEFAPTGKRLYNIRELRYAPTRVQQEQMIRNALTPVKQNFSREAVVVDGLMFAPETSDYARLTTLRIVFASIELIRQTAENYIGYPATMQHRNALDTAVGSQLRGMIVEGALIDADYNIAYSPAENTARIDLILTPAFEMRNIEVSISIRL